MKHLREIFDLRAASDPDSTCILSPNGIKTFKEVSVLGKKIGALIEARTTKPRIAASISSPTNLFWTIIGCLYANRSLAFLPVILDSSAHQKSVSKLEVDTVITDLESLLPEAPLFLDITHLINTATASHSEPPSITSSQLSDEAFLFRTSGTTGEPKWVRTTENQFLLAMHSMRDCARLEHCKDATAFITPPLSHSYGLSSTFEYFFAGGAIALPALPGPLGPLGDLLKSQHLSRITAIEAVPDFYVQMASQTKKLTNLNNVTHLGFGGGRLCEQPLRRIIASLPNIRTITVRYGMTETPSVISHATLTPNGSSHEWGSSGAVLPIYDIRIVDEEGKAPEADMPGIIEVKGECVALPYLGDPPSNQSFFPTGDLGYIDRHGQLRVVGRRSLFIKRRGHRISLEGIEDVVSNLTTVADCIVTYHDEKLVIEIVPEKKEMFDERTLRETLAKMLPIEEFPDAIKLVDTISRTESGKKKRHRIP